METTINTKIMKVYNFNSQEQAEREACRETAEDWMYGECFEVENVTYQYYTDNGKNVMLEITVDTITMFSITHIDLINGETTVYRWAD